MLRLVSSHKFKPNIEALVDVKRCQLSSCRTKANWNVNLIRFSHPRYTLVSINGLNTNYTALCSYYIVVLVTFYRFKIFRWWCGPRVALQVLMWPSEQFEFETPGLRVHG